MRRADSRNWTFSRCDAFREQVEGAVRLSSASRAMIMPFAGSITVRVFIAGQILAHIEGGPERDAFARTARRRRPARPSASSLKPSGTLAYRVMAPMVTSPLVIGSDKVLRTPWSRHGYWSAYSWTKGLSPACSSSGRRPW